MNEVSYITRTVFRHKVAVDTKLNVMLLHRVRRAKAKLVTQAQDKADKLVLGISDKELSRLLIGSTEEENTGCAVDDSGADF